MRKLLVLSGCFVMLIYSGSSFAYLDVGFTPIFSSVSVAIPIKNRDVSLQNDLDLNKSAVLNRGYLSIYMLSVNMRYYYTFQKHSESGNGLLPAGIAKEQDKKPLVVTSQFTFNDSHLEIGVPFVVNRNFLIETIFVSEWINPSINITGKDYNYMDNDQHSSLGIGVSVKENLSSRLALDSKFYLTNSSSLFEITSALKMSNIYCGVGYFYKKMDVSRFRIKISGPMIELGIIF